MSAGYTYDVAVSFASEDRAVVEEFVSILRREGVRIFYDLWEQQKLWGTDLYQYLDEVYRLRSRFCVIFISKAYAAKAWTSHELRSVQARAFEDKTQYMLPVRLDDTEVPGLPHTVGYQDLRKLPLGTVAALLLEKLEVAHAAVPDIPRELASPNPATRTHALNFVAIGKMHQHAPLAAALLTSDPDPEVRERAAWALDNLRDVAALDSLIAALNDSSFAVRSNAGWALVHLGAVVRSRVEHVFRESSNPEAREMAKLVRDRI